MRLYLSEMVCKAADFRHGNRLPEETEDHGG